MKPINIKLIVCIFLSCHYGICCQNDTNKSYSAPSIFIDLNYCDDINLYDDSLASRVKRVFSNPTEAEINSVNYKGHPSLLLIGRSDKMFEIVLYDELLPGSEIYKGWILKNDILRIFHKGMYCPEEYPLRLYSSPNIRAEQILNYSKNTEGVCVVVDFYKDWLKIKIKIEGQYHIGWLAPEDQCASVDTTCN